MAEKDKEYLEVERDISFRGRKYMGYAHWTKNGRKDVITLNLNMIHRHTRALWGDDEHMLINVISSVDFHEWLHLYIRRRSGLRGTFTVSDDCHDVMYKMDDILLGRWIGELLIWRNQTDPDSIAKFFEGAYEYGRRCKEA